VAVQPRHRNGGLRDSTVLALVRVVVVVVLLVLVAFRLRLLLPREHRVQGV
jgi:hypothetical protein